MKHALLAASALALAACGQQATTNEAAEAPAPDYAATQPAAMSDAEFVQAAANAGAFEIQSSQLAAQNASLQSVKDFAARMVTEHTTASEQLAALAPTLGMQAPTPQLDGAQQARLEGLRGQTGEAFDDAYLDAQVAAHENAVSTFERYISGAQAGPLRDWAQSTLPTLRQHLNDVRGLENAT